MSLPRLARTGVAAATSLVALVAAVLLAGSVSADDAIAPDLSPEMSSLVDPGAEPESNWVDPTLPHVLLGEGVPAPDVAGGPRPSASTGPRPAPAPGHLNADPEEIRRSHADAAPPLRPGFVDDYTRLWKSIESGVERVARLEEALAGARSALDAASGDLGLAIRVRNLAEISHAVAAAQLDTAVKDLYITGTTDIDVIIGVLGSEPDEVLRTIDSFSYMKAATGQEDVEFRSTRSAATMAAAVAVSSALLADEARHEAVQAAQALAAARIRLADDRADLDRLIAAAAPQTVVGPRGCPTAVLDGTVPAGVDVRALCRRAVTGAATAQAAFAVKWALVRLGAPYACDGVGRLAEWRYDCSSYVSRAYAEGAGLATATAGWAPSTRAMLPWDGSTLDPHYAPIQPDRIRPGDLVLYDTCPAGDPCPYRHVVMYLGALEPGGQEYMAHTNECGGVAHVAPFWGTSASHFLGVRRVIPAAGERVAAQDGAFVGPPKAARG